MRAIQLGTTTSSRCGIEGQEVVRLPPVFGQLHRDLQLDVHMGWYEPRAWDEHSRQSLLRSEIAA